MKNPNQKSDNISLLLLLYKRRLRLLVLVEMLKLLHKSRRKNRDQPSEEAVLLRIS